MKFASVLLLLAYQAVAAPIPATSSSLLVSGKPGLYRSIKGSSVNAAQTEWVLGTGPTGIPAVVTLYRSPEIHHGVQPVLTVRVDELHHNSDLKTYVKQWMKDYTLLGFNVRKAKQMKVSDNVAFVVDLEEVKSAKRLRQVVFLKDQTAVVMTCRDHKDTFDKTVHECNQIFKSFEWNSSPASSSQTGA